MNVKRSICKTKVHNSSSAKSNTLQRAECINEIIKILGQHAIPECEIVEILGKIIAEQKRKKVPDAIIYMDIFNYGYIMGKRAERMHRRGGVDND